MGVFNSVRNHAMCENDPIKIRIDIPNLKFLRSFYCLSSCCLCHCNKYSGLGEETLTYIAELVKCTCLSLNLDQSNGNFRDIGIKIVQLSSQQFEALPGCTDVQDELALFGLFCNITGLPLSVCQCVCLHSPSDI